MEELLCKQSWGVRLRLRACVIVGGWVGVRVGVGGGGGGGGGVGVSGVRTPPSFSPLCHVSNNFGRGYPNYLIRNQLVQPENWRSLVP